MLLGAGTLSSWCATSFARLSAVSLPSNPVCPSIFITLMSTDRLERCCWSEARFLILCRHMPVENLVTVSCSYRITNYVNCTAKV